MTLLEAEPSERTLTGDAVRWRSRVRFAFAGWIPLAYFRDLEGVVWDCPSCGTSGSLILRTRHTPYRRYWFRCGHCHRQLEADPILADTLTTEFGPARRRQPPHVQAWLDSENKPHASIDGVEHPVEDVGAEP